MGGETMENQILAALQQINEKLDSHSEILREHSETLNSHTEILNSHSETLKEHTRILGALINGQESLKAELNEMKLQNAKDFGEIKEQLKSHEVSIEILKEDTWDNRNEVRKIQKTLGMN